MRYTEQNLPQYLAKSEAELSYDAFLRRMEDQQDLDPRNFQITKVSLEEGVDPYLLIMGEHSLKRSRQRLGFLSKEDIQKLAIELLQLEEVKRAIQKYFVTWEDDRICAGDASGIDSIVVKDKHSHLTFCFIAGFSYILVKTVWDDLCGEFRTNNRNALYTREKEAAADK